MLFLAGFALHNADHLRRGLDVLTPEVFWAGTLSGIVTLAAIGMTLFRHPRAPQIAVAVGFGIAIGVSTVHLLPHWSAFSDSLPTGNADSVTWIAVLAEIGGALVFGRAAWLDIHTPSSAQKAAAAYPGREEGSQHAS